MIQYLIHVLILWDERDYDNFRCLNMILDVLIFPNFLLDLLIVTEAQGSAQ